MSTYSKEKRKKTGWIMLIILSLMFCGMCGCSKAKTSSGGPMEAISTDVEESTNLHAEEAEKRQTATVEAEVDSKVQETETKQEVEAKQEAEKKEDVETKQETEMKETTELKIPYNKLENCIYMWEDEEKKELLQGYVSLVSNEESKNYKYKNSDLLILEAKSSYPSIEDQNHEKLQKTVAEENKKQKESFEKQVKEALEWAESDVQGSVGTNEELNPIAPYEFDLSWQVIRNDDRMLTIVYSLYSYAGGAHPNLYKSVVSFRPDTGEKIQVKSITDDVKTVKKIIVQELNAFVTDNQCEAYLFGNEVYKEVFEQWDTNWWVQNGILFVGFNTYDIAPYVAGPLVIPVPLSKIETYLNTYGKSLQD